jgi:hypothetical protein
MVRKHAILATLDPACRDAVQHWPCYHRNLALVLMHRWLATGADRQRMDDVRAAHQAALALTTGPRASWPEPILPSVIDWILHPPALNDLKRLPNMLGWDAEDQAKPLVAPDVAYRAARELSELVQLSDCWENTDVLSALSVALQRDLSTRMRALDGGVPEGMIQLACFAWFRAGELVDSGGSSLHSEAPRGEALKAMLDQPCLPHHDERVVYKYRELRAAAEVWASSRRAYLIDRLQQGDHPDTNPEFWSDFQGYSRPDIPDIDVHSRRPLSFPSLVTLLAGVLIPLSLLTMWIMWEKSRLAK